MADYTIKRGDRGLELEIPIEEKDPVSGEWGPKSLAPFAGGVAKLLLKSTGATITGNGTMAGNVVSYVFDADDLQTAGEYDGEIEFTSADLAIRETVPNGHDGEAKYFTVEVPEDLG